MHSRYLTRGYLRRGVLIGMIALGILGCGPNNNRKLAMEKKQDTAMKLADAKSKIAVYQLMVRLFGNKTEGKNLENGSIEQNGCGKFGDITAIALAEIKKLGISHVWYTGIIEHATMTDYTKYGIKKDDPDVVKGRAGSPYAIKDYYDVDPDLAENPQTRMAEFESLVKRTHNAGLRVIIDFIPNHVARSYASDASPQGTQDFGKDDDTSKAFSDKNDFYYVPNKALVIPKRKESPSLQNRLGMDGKFDESPAKATGNNVFDNKPSVDDWFETVKLNYGVDYKKNESHYFEPIPPVWNKMFEILDYWANKGVDGFRCDVAEMVPVEFWSWVLPKVKQKHPGIVFIAEAYDPTKYEEYLTKGHFDFLYDKVGLYDDLKALIKEEKNSTTRNLINLNNRYANYSDKMLRFLENHDEERIASKAFAGNPWKAVPAMVASATLSGGPIMIYFAQEVGEPALGIEGFSKNDGRTTIFDYWAVPEHQKWMNGGTFDGALLSDSQRKLRLFYSTLLNFSNYSKAILNGKLLEVSISNKPKAYAFWRYTEEESVLVILNFDFQQPLHLSIPLTAQLPRFMKDSKRKGIEVFSNKDIPFNNDRVEITTPAGQAMLCHFTN